MITSLPSDVEWQVGFFLYISVRRRLNPFCKNFPVGFSPICPRNHSFHKYLLNIGKLHLCPFPVACGYLPRVDIAA